MCAQNVCEDAIFVVPPEEMTGYKSLRRVVDQVFVATERFFPSSITYIDIESTEHGINRHLRSMLIVPTQHAALRNQRGEHISRNTDGTPEDSSVVKRTQRQSKQKERCENRLMSLLFATIYDPATRRCRLAQDVPPLKMRRADKNGQVRSVSNYTDVRAYLRNAMTSILSSYSESMKVLSQILPDQFGVLPVIFAIIARALMVIIKVQSCDNEEADTESLRQRAKNALDYSMLSIQHFITTWERRNFSTDNPLLHCLEAGMKNEHYAAVRRLLELMIYILPPTGAEPYDEQFRAHYIYAYGLPCGESCSSGTGNKCTLTHKCPGSGPLYISREDTAIYFEYVDALSKCAEVKPTLDISLLEDMIVQKEFSPAAWKYAEGLSQIHRTQKISDRIRIQRLHTKRSRDLHTMEHLEGLRSDIATCWSAIGRSNARTWLILDKLKIDNKENLKETAIELIFGGAMAAIALFERRDEIIPICHNLQCKKSQAPAFRRRSEDWSDDKIMHHLNAKGKHSMNEKGDSEGVSSVKTKEAVKLGISDGSKKNEEIKNSFRERFLASKISSWVESAEGPVSFNCTSGYIEQKNQLQGFSRKKEIRSRLKI